MLATSCGFDENYGDSKETLEHLIGQALEGIANSGNQQNLLPHLTSVLGSLGITVTGASAFVEVGDRLAEPAAAAAGYLLSKVTGDAAKLNAVEFKAAGKVFAVVGGTISIGQGIMEYCDRTDPTNKYAATSHVLNGGATIAGIWYPPVAIGATVATVIEFGVIKYTECSVNTANDAACYSAKAAMRKTTDQLIDQKKNFESAVAHFGEK